MTNPQDVQLYKKYLKLPILVNKKDKCCFNQADLSCSIYQLRPAICRSFPVVLINKNINSKIIPSFQINELADCSKDCLNNINFSIEDQARELIRGCFNYTIAIKNNLLLLVNQGKRLIELGFKQYLG